MPLTAALAARPPAPASTRRFARDLSLVLALKSALLVLAWWLWFAHPQARQMHLPPAEVSRHLFGEAALAAGGATPLAAPAPASAAAAAPPLSTGTAVPVLPSGVAAAAVPVPSSGAAGAAKAAPVLSTAVPVAGSPR